ncbi:MAG: hypothetical protein M9910_10205 [Kiritimatiellae bacterium]|nr:hypothetical protein [Kiritimatiellia bacterium]
MAAPVKIAVQDANILIDLELAGLFDLWFQAGIETHTTDLIRAELENGQHEQALGYFKSKHIREHRLAYEELQEVARVEREVGNKAKFNDCSVLYLAEKIDAMMLSGDKALRNAGKARQIEVHGTLWIFDLLIEKGLLSGKVAAAKLDSLIRNDRHLPRAECEQRFRKWRTG